MKGQGKRWSKNQFARDGWSGASLRISETRQWRKKEGDYTLFDRVLHQGNAVAGLGFFGGSGTS
jgi:hypothetical protein